MADNAPDPNKWDTSFFQHYAKPIGVGSTLITRKGRGLMTDDSPGYFYFPPGTPKHYREEPDDSGSYRRGGRVRRYAGGGAIDTGTVPHFDTGGQQPFGYDPRAYVERSGQIAQGLLDRGDTEYKFGQDQFAKNEGTANQVIAAALRNAGLFDDAAGAGLSRYQKMYGPAMEQHLNFARNFSTPAQLEAARGRGIANVGAAYDAQSAAAADALRGEGLDPKAIGMRLDSSIRTKRAADSVAAGNTDVLNREIAGQTMLGQSIGLGQADANLTNQFAGLGMAGRNQAINTGLATTQSGVASKAASLPYSTAGATELKEWPKAELDAMHASNEQGALWNDINRTGLQGLQIANQSGSGAGAMAGAGLGALASMFKFSPITLSHGGTVPHAAGGGTLALGSNWRKFAYTNPVGNPEAIDVETPEVKKSEPAKYGSQPFEFKIGGSSTGTGDEVTAGPPPVMGGEYLPGDLGGAGYEPFAPGNNPAGVDGPAYRRGGTVKKYYNAGTVDTTDTPSAGDYAEKYTRKVSGMIPSGYAGFAGDAVALGRDMWDPSAQDEEHTHDIFGDRTQTQGERVGKDVARPIGRAIGAIWGMPGAGAAAGEDIGGPVVDFFHGDVGKGFENLGRNVADRGIGMMSSMGGGMGGGGLPGMPGGGGGLPGMPGGGGGGGAGTIMNLVRGLGGGGAGDPGAGTGGSEVTDTGAWELGGDMGGMGGDMGMGDMGFAVARGGQIPLGPLGRLAHLVAGGRPEDLQGPVTPPQPGAIQTGDTVPASAQVPGIEGPDKVPAMVAAGEGILPQRFMRWRGEQWLQKEIAKADKEMQKPQVAGPEEGPTPQAAIQTGPTFASEGAMS